MEFTNGRSKALFGGLLWGDQLMRFIFMDEAGISAGEPVTVVVGIIANADEHVMAGEALALEIMGSVPPQFKEGFVFSAKSVLGNSKYQKDWSLTERLSLVKAMMSVPRRIGMAVCVAAQWRGAVDDSDTPQMRPEQLEHVKAFSMCVTVADRNIRAHAGPREVASVVAEDLPEMRKFFQRTLKFYREEGQHLSPELLRRTALDEAAGYLTQSGEMRVTRIRNSIHFVEKSEDPLVQVADACAFGFRRYFAKEKFGEDFASAILGHHSAVAHFAFPGGAACWWP